MFEKKDPDWTWQYGFDQDDLESRRTHANTFFIGQSGFRFIDDHFGPRPGCLHTLLGGSGRGKSTLVQSLVLEWGKTSPVLLYLTEESKDVLELKLANMEARPQYLTQKLHVVHEHDLLRDGADYSHPPDFFRAISAKIKASGAKIFVFDNLTTSIFYEGQFRNVMSFLGGLREMAVKLDIAIFVLCHPKKGLNESKGLLTPEDVRGSASLGMTSDYFYTLYRIQQTSMSGALMMGTFVYVNKARHHSNQDCVYRAEYDSTRKRYFKDVPVSFELFKKFVRDRDRL